MKPHIKKPKTIQEAIDDLQVFLECDLYTKFRPQEKIKLKGKSETFYRVDAFKNEKDFIRYIRDHFNILRKQVRNCSK